VQQLLDDKKDGTGCVNCQDPSRDNPDDENTTALDADIAPAMENQAVKQPRVVMSDASSEAGNADITDLPTNANTVDAKETDIPPSKRRLVRTACLPCRKRKSKVTQLWSFKSTNGECDGTLPRCKTCQIHKTECHYDFDADRRRWQFSCSCV
jgi:hypothetical protein